VSLGFETGPLKNPNNCTDVYTPSFWLGKPGVLTQIRMPDAGLSRSSSDNFAVHNLLDGQAVDRSPYLCRVWQFQHEWLKPDVMSVLMEYATRQRGIGPFILIDPQMKNLLTPNQASGTDSLHMIEGFAVDAPPTIAGFDTYDRTPVSNNWGTSTSGHLWVIEGTASQYATTGTVGQHNIAALNTNVRSTLSGVNVLNPHIVHLSTISVAPTGDYVRTDVVGRFTNVNNFYALRVHRLVSGAIDLQLIRVAGAVETVIASAPSGVTGTAGVGMWFVFDIIDSTLRGKIWRTDQTEPVAWMITVTDSVLTTAGLAGVASLLPPSNTNTRPYTVTIDTFSVSSLTEVSLLASSTDDSMQGERSLSWTMSPPVTGTSTILHVRPSTGLYGFCIPPTSQSSKRVAFSGYVKLASTSLDTSVQVTPQMVFMNGIGSVQSTVTGATLTAVTGTAGSGWQAFCVTGSVPAGQSGVYLEPQFAVVNATVTAQTVFLFDQLQLEIIDGTTCTQWEYGQGQPLVGVRSDGENVPRVLRTNVNYIAVEVT
jgi:hypothetical protein